MTDNQPLPTFEIQARPLCVPPEIVGMHPATMIKVVGALGGGDGYETKTAADYVQELTATIARQAEGYFTVEEAAQVLADTAPGVEAKEMIRKMLNANLADKLPIRSTGDKTHVDDRSEVRAFIHLLSIDDVNTWLASQGVRYRWPEQTQPHPKRESANEWISEAQSRAHEIIKEQRAKDLYPDQLGIADQIAREFRTAGKVGADGKPISGAYIKRHALKGITSAIVKQLSTSKRQSK